MSFKKMLLEMLQALGSELPQPEQLKQKRYVSEIIKDVDEIIWLIVADVNEGARQDAILREQIEKDKLRPGSQRTF